VTVLKVDLLRVVLSVLHRILINIESDSSLGGFIDGRINGALEDINQY
jgi:hypothetical protein